MSWYPLTGNTKGGKYHCTIDLLFDLFGLVSFANNNKNCQLPYSCFQTSQTGGQWYNDTSPFSIPCLLYWQYSLFEIPLDNDVTKYGSTLYCFRWKGIYLIIPTMVGSLKTLDDWSILRLNPVFLRKKKGLGQKNFFKSENSEFFEKRKEIFFFKNISTFFDLN